MSELLRVLGLGAGGHARVALESLRAAGGYEPVGFLDPREELWGTLVDGVPVLGGDDLLAPQYDAGVTRMFVGLGSPSDTRPRRHLYERARAAGFEAVTIVDPSARVSTSASLAAGATVLPLAAVNAGAAVGANAIVNTHAVVEHDCVVGDHAHVASGATLASGVVVGEGAHVGAGAVVRQGIRVGAGAVVGVGAAVVADVAAGSVVVGVPARPLRRLVEEL
jgi:sugar O-acyltransferase (sialic acid O-acetyltransferase NeuD family)